MEDPRITRLNELAKKKKEEGLTDQEFIEQHELYAWYIEQVKKNLMCQVEEMGFKKKSE
ncbi:MAG: DUF896 domain-containing protein [Syntrophomonadaceae bacterium]